MSLLFFTSALNGHKNFIILYSYFANKFNENSKFEFLVNNLNNDELKNIENFSKEFKIDISLNFITEYKEINPQLLRFLIEPNNKCDYTYIGDIDILINEKILDFHIEQMNKFQTIWDNQQRLNDLTKITGLHFIKSNEWYEKTIKSRIKYLNPKNSHCINDEVILKNIIWESKLNSKFDDTLRKRPLHGLHLSLNRVPFTDKMTFPIDLYKSMFIDDFLQSDDFLKLKQYLSEDMINIINTCTNYVLNESSNK
jgi:hypothetical protein